MEIGSVTAGASLSTASPAFPNKRPARLAMRGPLFEE
jgi:hypothetical protein